MGFIWIHMVASIEILWSRCIPYCGIPMFFFIFFRTRWWKCSRSRATHEHLLSCCEFSSLGLKVKNPWSSEQVDHFLKSDFEYTHVCLFVKIHFFPQNLTSRFVRKAWKSWPFSIFQKLPFSIFQKPLLYTSNLPVPINWHSSPVAADFGERVLRCSYGIGVKTRVALNLWDTFTSRLTDWFLY